jgi:hypothetical protein
VNDARVVDDENIPRLQKGRQVAHDAVVETAPRRDDEQARAVARLGGPQRNPVLGEIEIEEIDAHGRVRALVQRVMPALVAGIHAGVRPSPGRGWPGRARP